MSSPQETPLNLSSKCRLLFHCTRFFSTHTILKKTSFTTKVPKEKAIQIFELEWNINFNDEKPTNSLKALRFFPSKVFNKYFTITYVDDLLPTFMKIACRAFVWKN
jgi:hypothetical protein